MFRVQGPSIHSWRIFFFASWLEFKQLHTLLETILQFHVHWGLSVWPVNHDTCSIHSLILRETASPTFPLQPQGSFTHSLFLPMPSLAWVTRGEHMTPWATWSPSLYGRAHPTRHRPLWTNWASQILCQEDRGRIRQRMGRSIRGRHTWKNKSYSNIGFPVNP